MHNSSVFDSHPPWIGDALWHTANSSLILYLLSDPSSDIKLRQAVASFCHFHRLIATSVFSLCDLGLSALTSHFVKTQLFDPRQVKKRSFKRLMLTLRVNGGVYEQLFEILASSASVFPDFTEILNSPPFLEPAKHPEFPPPSVVSLFEKELKLNFRDTFTAVPTIAADVKDSIYQYDLQLTNGPRVTLHVESPVLKRMRSFDLFPFRCISSVLSVIPFLHPERALLDAVIQRIDASLEKERAARLGILEKFNVKPLSSIQRFFSRARSIPIGFYVPGPITRLSSDHIMVTDVEARAKPVPSDRLRRDILGSVLLTLGATNLLFPNVGIRDIRANDERLSLREFGTCITVDSARVESARRFAVEQLRGKCAEFMKVAQKLGIDQDVAELAVGSGTMKTVRDIARRDANFVVGGAEVIGALAGHVVAANPLERAAMTTRAIISIALKEK